MWNKSVLTSDGDVPFIRKFKIYYLVSPFFLLQIRENVPVHIFIDATFETNPARMAGTPPYYLGVAGLPCKSDIMPCHVAAWVSGFHTMTP